MLADTLAACFDSLTAYVQRVWSTRKHVQLPSYLRPPSVRVRVIEVEEETERQRKAHAYSSSVVHESVLLQYAVDTSLDQTLQQLFEVCRVVMLLKRASISVGALRAAGYLRDAYS